MNVRRKQQAWPPSLERSMEDWASAYEDARKETEVDGQTPILESDPSGERHRHAAEQLTAVVHHVVSGGELGPFVRADQRSLNKILSLPKQQLRSWVQQTRAALRDCAHPLPASPATAQRNETR